MAYSRKNRYTVDTESNEKVTYEATPVYLRRNSSRYSNEAETKQRTSEYRRYSSHEPVKSRQTYSNTSDQYARQYKETVNHTARKSYEPKKSYEELNTKQKTTQPVKDVKKKAEKEKSSEKVKKTKTTKKTKQNTDKKPKRKLRKPKFLGKLKELVHKSNKAKVIIGLLVVLIPGVCVIGYMHRDQSVTKVCESNISYNKGIGYTFYVGHDGKTIDTIEKNDTVSLSFIKKNLGDENAEEILSEYKNKTKESYETVTKKYKKYSWFSSDIQITKKKVVVNYRIKVSDKTFSYKKYEDVMSEFGMTYFYNQDKKAFIYDESAFLSTQIPLGSIEGVQCYSSDKTLEVKPTSELKESGDTND